MGLVMHAEKTVKTGLSLADLREMPVPEGTDTHHPIGHHVLRDMVADHLEPLGLKIRDEQHAVADFSEDTKVWNKAFGVFDVSGADDDTASVGFAIGYRNSMNKKLPAGICFGSRVFVCDNLSFSAEIVMKRRHTKNILDDLPTMIHGALERFDTYKNRQIELYDRLRDTKVTDDTAAAIVVEACQKTRKGFLAKKNVLDILECYNHDPATDAEREAGIVWNRDQHGHGTAWSLFNAGTLFAKNRLRTNMVDGSSELIEWHGVFTSRFGD